MTKNLSQQLRPLLVVQEIDLEIVKLQNEFDQLPQQIQALQTQKSTLHEKQEAIQTQTRQLQLEEHRLKVEIHEELERILSYEKHLKDTKINREQQALLREVGISKKAKAEAEEATVDIMSQIENKQKDKQQLDDDLLALNESLQKLEDQYQIEKTKVDKKLKELTKRRQDVLNTVPAQVISRYNLIQKRHTIAVVEATQGTCSGCHRHLPPQLYNQILRDQQLITCPNCHRILLPPTIATTEQ